MSKLRARVGMANMAKILLKAFNLVIIIKLIFRNIDKTLKYAHVHLHMCLFKSISTNIWLLHTIRNLWGWARCTRRTGSAPAPRRTTASGISSLWSEADEGYFNEGVARKRTIWFARGAPDTQVWRYFLITIIQPRTSVHCLSLIGVSTHVKDLNISITQRGIEYSIPRWYYLR